MLGIAVGVQLPRCAHDAGELLGDDIHHRLGHLQFLGLGGLLQGRDLGIVGRDGLLGVHSRAEQLIGPQGQIVDADLGAGHIERAIAVVGRNEHRGDHLVVVVVQDVHKDVTLLGVAHLAPPQGAVQLVEVVDAAGVVLGHAVFPDIALVLRESVALQILYLLFDGTVTLAAGGQIGAGLVVAHREIIVDAAYHHLEIRAYLLVVHIGIIKADVQRGRIDAVICRKALEIDPAYLVEEILHRDLAPERPRQFEADVIGRADVVVILLRHELAVGRRDGDAVRKRTGGQVILQAGGL